MVNNKLISIFVYNQRRPEQCAWALGDEKHRGEFTVAKTFFNTTYLTLSSCKPSPRTYRCLPTVAFENQSLHNRWDRDQYKEKKILNINQFDQFDWGFTKFIYY